MSILRIALGVALVVVLARVGHLQIVLGPYYREMLDGTEIETRVLPTLRGRILSSDGSVLARDEASLSVCLHYRYLQRPTDDTWLTQQARRRLSRRERRDRTRVEQEEHRVRQEMDRLFRRLARVLGCEESSLREAAGKVQQRVETISLRVNAQRGGGAPGQARDGKLPLASGRTLGASPSTGGAALLSRGWDLIRDALTAEPESAEPDPLVLQEEHQYHPIFTWPPGAEEQPEVLAIVAEIEGHAQRYPGTRVVRQYRRHYPQGPLACHLVGYLGPITAAELAAQADGTGDGGSGCRYEASDWLGRAGAEASYERALRGRRGEVREVVDTKAQVLAVLDQREPQPGADIVLWLDPALQRAVEVMLEKAVGDAAAVADSAERETAAGSQRPSRENPRRLPGAALVVVDVRTGGIVAAGSVPRFDPNALINPTSETWEALNSDPRRPLYNRVMQMALAPGSVFKTLSAVAVMQSGRIDAEDPYYCQGYLHTPSRLRCLIYNRFGQGHGETTLVDAISRSCNVYFFHCAEVLGPEPICRWAESFGFGQPTGVDLLGENPGLLPTPWNVRERLGRTWRNGDTPRLAIGQSDLLVTPLQIARLMAAVANGGTLVAPKVVRNTVERGETARGQGSEVDGGRGPGSGVRGPGSGVRGQEAAQGASEAVGSQPAGVSASSSAASGAAGRIPGLSARTLAVVREGLHRVVADERGTGHKTVYLQDIAIAGKTGTAEVAGAGGHAWFAGYVPSDEPRYAFAIVLQHAGSGARDAGPLARQLVKTMLELGYFAP